jgi:hypothetical protein
MTKIETIKEAALQLSDAEMAALRDWFDEQAELRFDEQIERDERAGKLEPLAERGRANLKAGRVTDL